jgi:replicative superfamily II helicase
LFVGINRYKSIDVRNLASAVRDAQALHALFADNLGGDTTLVTDCEATSTRLREELTRLAQESSSDDVVMISFSGHGSDSHELVTYEADLYNLTATTLPLDEFTHLISAIPARHLLVVLDCCFAGGAGAKVLNSVAQSRGYAGRLPLSTEAFLTHMVGTGRVLLTASTAEQEAYEDVRLGHGYLTYYLLRALMGEDGQTPAASVHLLEVLQYVTGQVKAGVSGTFAARQEPTVRGQWDGDVVWPRFVRGALYDALFPPTSPPPVTADLGTLSAYRLPDEIIEAWRAGIGELNRLQQDAINTTGLFTGGNVVVTAPTSSGKTMVGELASLKATQSGGRSVFLLPTKALVNEQHERFDRTYGGCGVRVVRATGDYRDDVDAVLRGQFDLGLFTYEKFSGLALAHPHLLQMLSVIVVDEVQTIVDPGRGRDLELLLTLMKSRKDEGVEPQLVTLSAVLGDLNGLDTWLEADLLRSDVRPVDLDEGVLTQDGTYRYLDANRAEQTLQLMPPAYGDPRARTLLVPLVDQLVAEGQQVIVVRGIRGEARGAAEYLANTLSLSPADRVLDALPIGDPTQSSTALRRCLARGVAFHISDLGAEERRLIEEEFRRPQSQIRVVVATTTLAQGVNLPAETVIMPELSRFLGRERGRVWYTVADYKNIAGRAGRLGLADKGRAIVLSHDGASYSTIWNHYISGSPEDVTSQLLDPNVDLYTVVLRVTALAAQRSTAGSVAVHDVIDILANSLGAHQARLEGVGDPFDAATLGNIVRELQDVGFLEATTPDQTKLTSLGELVAASMLTVSSAVRVANGLRRVSASQLNLPTLLALAQISEELDETRLTVNAKGVNKELSTFLNGLRSRGVAGSALDVFSIGAANRVAVAARAKKSMAALLWVNGVRVSQIETYVMQHHRDRNASGPIAQVAARTRDVIETVLDMATEIHPTLVLDAERTSLPLRLELGIPHSCVALARAGADLRRDDYRALDDAGLLDEGAAPLSEVDDDHLLDLLGGDPDRLARLRQASADIAAEAEVPDLDDLLPPHTR